jgi:hypothetical protein
MKLITHHVFPPIPIRQFDWTAYDDNLGCEEGCPVGWGSTEAEATADLMAQLHERAQEALAAPAGVSRLPHASGSGQDVSDGELAERDDFEALRDYVE